MGELDSVLVPGKGLRVTLPAGHGCYYVDEGHEYWRLKEDGGRGTRLTGVTTAVKTLDLSPDALMRWAARTNGIGIAQLVSPVLDALEEAPDPTLAVKLEWLRDHTTIWQTLEDEQLTYDDVKTAKGVVGTNVHELAFQALGVGKAVPDLDKMTPEERVRAQAVMAFFLDHDPQVHQVEQIVCDPELGVAGRLDLRCTLGSTCGDTLCPCNGLKGPGIVDAKTGNYISAAAHAQLQGYRYLARVSGFGDSDWACLLKLREDGSYELVRAEGDQGDFLNAVATYRSAGRIDREAGKARAARAGK